MRDVPCTDTSRHRHSRQHEAYVMTGLLPLCQIALSATDRPRAHHWYRRALGFLSAGAKRHREQPDYAEVPDLPELSMDVWCLVDRQPWFQIELFEFQRPRMRLQPVDWRPCDLGYALIGIHVDDFDAALDRLARTSGRLLGGAVGAAGSRRVCLRDPDGILLELMEDDPCRDRVTTPARPEVPVATRFVTASVHDLDRARRFWIDALGFSERRGLSLHAPEHEALWGQSGAQRRAAVLGAGDFLIELVQYERPQGR